MRGSRGGREQGVRPPPLRNHKNKCFLSILVQIPWKITKMRSQNSMLGHYWHASETPFKWHFVGVLIMTRLYWQLDPPSPHQLKKMKKCQNWVWPPLTKLSGVTLKFYSEVKLCGAANENWQPGMAQTSLLISAVSQQSLLQGIDRGSTNTNETQSNLQFRQFTDHRFFMTMKFTFTLSDRYFLAQVEYLITCRKCRHPSFLLHSSKTQN